MSLRPDLNGLRVQSPGKAPIYLVDGGQKRHVPDMPTYTRLFEVTTGIDLTQNLDAIATGPAISGDARLVTDGTGAVYLLEGQVKRHIDSPDTMTRYAFSWNQIQGVTAGQIASWSSGPTIV